MSHLERPGFMGDGRIKQILYPGKYCFDPANQQPWRPIDWREPDVAEKRAGIVRTPNRVRITDVTWHQSQDLNWTAYLPTGSQTISVPVDVAEDASLGYYNCRLISPDDVISLNNRSIITDYRYSDDYLQQYVMGVLGFSSIEQHEFAHIDKPLDECSGHLVIGKMDPTDQSLELTAFIVKRFQSVYITAHTIHTNDYLLGRWETLLSSSCKFPSARIKHVMRDPLPFSHQNNLPPLSFIE